MGLALSLIARSLSGHAGALLTPENFLHEILEVIVADTLATLRLRYLREHLGELFLAEMLTLTTEAFLQVSLGDVASVINVEVMERKQHIVLCDCLSTVDSDCKEFCVVDLTVMVKVNSFEDSIDLLFRHLKLVEGSTNLVDLKSARIVCIEGTESIAKLCKVECASINLIDQELKSLNL